MSPKLVGTISVAILGISAMKGYAGFQEKKDVIKTVTVRLCKDALMVIARGFVMYTKIVGRFPVCVKITNVSNHQIALKKATSLARA